MATIHSTIISGAGASSALLPLLTGKTSILLVTDKNVGALEATRRFIACWRLKGVKLRSLTACQRSPTITMLRRSSASWAPASRRWSLVSAGSVLDVAKLLSVLLHPEAPSLTSLLAGEQPRRRICSLLIPATAGTGSKRRRTPFWRSPSSRRRWGSSPRCCFRTMSPCCRS